MSQIWALVELTIRKRRRLNGLNGLFSLRKSLNILNGNPRTSMTVMRNDSGSGVAQADSLRIIVTTETSTRPTTKILHGIAILILPHTASCSS